LRELKAKIKKKKRKEYLKLEILGTTFKQQKRKTLILIIKKEDK
jgi:hypothetical protein